MSKFLLMLDMLFCIFRPRILIHRFNNELVKRSTFCIRLERSQGLKFFPKKNHDLAFDITWYSTCLFVACMRPHSLLMALFVERQVFYAVLTSLSLSCCTPLILLCIRRIPPASLRIHFIAGLRLPYQLKLPCSIWPYGAPSGPDLYGLKRVYVKTRLI